MTDWPQQLRPGAMRFGHASSHYDDTVRFYRDLIGLPVVGSFTDSFDTDGTIFGLPDTTLQIEIIRADGAGAARDFEQLVFYLDDAAAVAAATRRLREAGLTPDPEQHPYWQANGAVTDLPRSRRSWRGVLPVGLRPRPRTDRRGRGQSTRLSTARAMSVTSCGS